MTRWAAWRKVGTAVVAQGAWVTAVAHGDDGTQAFVVGKDGLVYGTARTGTGSWSAWQKIGTLVVAQGTRVAAAARGDDVDLVVVGQDGHLHRATWRPTTGWGAWVDVGMSVPVGTKLTAIARGTDALEVFFVSSDGSVIVVTWTTKGGWTRKRIGTAVVAGGSRVAAVALAPDRMDAFVVGLDGCIWGVTWAAQPGWGAWKRIGTAVVAQGTPITAAAHGADQVELLVVGLNGRIYRAGRDGSAGWTAWQTVGTATVAQGSEVATAQRRGRGDVALVGQDGRVYTTTRDAASGWSAWQKLGTAVVTKGTPVTAVAGAHDLDLFVVGQEGRVYTAHNGWDRCVYLGKRASVATQVTVESYLGTDHTLAAWVMPQFSRTDYAAVFGVSGTGSYLVGAGDYHTGDFGATPTGTSPVLTVRIGSAAATYLAPAWTAGAWHHLAVRRSGETVTLHLDGVRLSPFQRKSSTDPTTQKPITTIEPGTDVKIGATTKNLPKGILCFGTSAHPTRFGVAKVYGLLDDVALFGRALTDEEISGLHAAQHVWGEEPDLVTMWTLDGIWNKPPAAATPTSVVPDLRISSDRSALDAALLASPAVLSSGLPVVRLPFNPGEVWNVNYGIDWPTLSHNGYATYCWDFGRVDGPTGNSDIVACADSDVYTYKRDEPLTVPREANNVITTSDLVTIEYLHLAGDSLTSAVTGGEHTSQGEQKVYPTTARSVVEGEKLAEVGPHANHLHLAGFDRMVKPGDTTPTRCGTTMPMAFSGLEVDSGTGWRDPGAAYIPRTGDKVRRK